MNDSVFSTFAGVNCVENLLSTKVPWLDRLMRTELEYNLTFFRAGVGLLCRRYRLGKCGGFRQKEGGERGEEEKDTPLGSLVCPSTLGRKGFASQKPILNRSVQTLPMICKFVS